MADASSYTERATVERFIRAQSGHVPVPIAIIEKAGAEPAEVSDGAALWAKPKSEIKPADYTDFYRSIAGQFDEPALTIHFHAEGRHEYISLFFVPGSRPFDLFDPDRKGRIKLYVKRVFITDDADILPRYLRFVRGLVDCADLPLNVSREKIQESPLLAAIRKGDEPRAGELETPAGRSRRPTPKSGTCSARCSRKVSTRISSGARPCSALSRFKTTGPGGWRASRNMSPRSSRARRRFITSPATTSNGSKSSPHLEGFRARGIEVLLLPDPVDSVLGHVGHRSRGQAVQVGHAGRGRSGADSSARRKGKAAPAELQDSVKNFLAFIKSSLGDAVADVRASDRLTDSAVCLVAAESGPDRALEKLLAGAGRHAMRRRSRYWKSIRGTSSWCALAGLGDGEQTLKEDAAHLLFDEARVLEGERPADPRAFSERLARVLGRSVGKGA